MKIVVVDDVATNRKLLRVTLAAEGHTTIEAGDGIEALAILANEKVDAILTDILMPRMDGYRLCHEIRTDNRLRDLPIVIYTATYTSLDDEKLALNLGADIYLKKPAPVGAVIGALHEAIAMQRPLPQSGYVREVEVLKEYSNQLLSKLEERNIKLEQGQGRLLTQVARLHLLDRITLAIGERQDLRGIYQVVVRNLEDNLPINFGCVCLYDPASEALTVTCLGIRSEALAMDLAMTENARIGIDQNGLAHCIRGQLVYEPDLASSGFPFFRHLATGGLRALVVAPLVVESQVFGLLIVARMQAESFASGECEFLKQLSDHVALAAHQAELHAALKRSYEELHRTQQGVVQQERLRALGEMASGIAHDINNAVSPIALYTSWLLEQEPNLSARARSYLEITQRAIDDVGNTVARMREFCRPREPHLEFEPADMNELVQQTVDLTRARWSDMPQQHGVVIDIRIEAAKALPAVAGIESEIREALTNLIFNAVDAMERGGILTIRTGSSPADSPPSLKQYIYVEVADNGAGMDEDTRRRCLEPFFTTKGTRGTGLGLAMVYGVIQRHGGGLEIDSAVGEGTTVRLKFPAASDEPSKPAASTLCQRPLRVLVVDDDPLVLSALRDILEADSHVVTSASGGQEGINVFLAAEPTEQRFDVAITDLGMPYVDGHQVAHALKGASASTPVILLTGWGHRLLASGEVPLHVDLVLSKPPKLNELRQALAELSR